MTNDINLVLASKRSWRNVENRRKGIERRQKDGTAQQRKDTADAIRLERRTHQPYCTCSNCQDRPSKRIKWPFWYRWLHRMWIKILPFIIVLILCTNSYAYTASWYGVTGDTTDPWKHTLTASGQRFNENALTAASWKYPLGTRVRVTNMANGRSVVVLINDRGPGKHLYRKGRVIDLSRGSFEWIANLKSGVINVKVRKL